MKIWATDLDRWQQHRSLAELMQDRRPRGPGLRMGNRFHNAMRKRQDASLRMAAREGGRIFLFEPRCSPSDLELPYARETRVKYETRGGHVVTGRVDALIMNGSRPGVVDYKTSLEALDPGAYHAGLWQWRIYLCAFRPARFFRYHLFELGRPAQTGGLVRVPIVDHRAVDLERPTNLVAQVELAIDRFVHVARALGWKGR